MIIINEARERVEYIIALSKVILQSLVDNIHGNVIDDIDGYVFNSIYKSYDINKIFKSDMNLLDLIEYHSFVVKFEVHEDKYLEKNVKGYYNPDLKKVHINISKESLIKNKENIKEYVMTGIHSTILVHELRHYFDDILSNARAFDSRRNREYLELRGDSLMNPNDYIKNIYLLLPHEISSFFVQRVSELIGGGIKIFNEGVPPVKMDSSFKSVLKAFKRSMLVYDMENSDTTKVSMYYDEKTKQHLVKALYTVWTNYNKDKIKRKNIINYIDSLDIFKKCLIIWDNSDELTIYYDINISEKQMKYYKYKMNNYGIKLNFKEI